jgi:hypothetical protein
MAGRILPVYILATGGSSVIVGLSNAFNNFLSAVYSLPGGYLTDRWANHRLSRANFFNESLRKHGPYEEPTP